MLRIFGCLKKWSLAMAVLAATVPAAALMGCSEGVTDAPIVESFSPESTKEVPVDAPISITFDKGMIAPLAERALRIEPPVEGDYNWSGNTLQFSPRTGWARGTRYQVTIDQSARSTFLQPLKEPVSFEFMTAKDLSVVSVQPGDGASEISPSSSIAVQFSYPIVPLGTTGVDPNPLQIDPPVDGKGRWLTTSLYIFQPEGGFPAGINYSVTVPKGLADTGGSSLADDYKWSFSTKPPAVSKVYPETGSKYVGPNSEIRVDFDQPVDHASAEERISVKGPDGTAVAGTTSWENETLLFKPSAPFELETSYTAVIGAGVKAARGGGEAKEFSWSFTTVGKPSVVETIPSTGEVDHPSYDSLGITFSNPMNPESVEKHLSISPKPTSDWHIGWQRDDTMMWVWGNLKPSTNYSLALSGDAEDRYGQKLGTPLTLSFKTAPLPPSINVSIPGQVGTFNAAGSPTVFVEHTNVSRIDFALYKLTRWELMQLSTDYRARERFSLDHSKIVRAWSELPSSPERDVSLLTSTALGSGQEGKLEPGFYYLNVSAPENVSDSRLLVVSRLGLTMKRAGKQMLVWATDLTSGDVVPNVPVRVMSSDGETLATGETDKDGVVTFSNIAISEADTMGVLFAFAEGEGDAGAVSSDWMEGIYPFEFNLPWEPYAEPYRGHLYTDRPIYRPGQKVLFKGIVRSDDDAHYTVPTSDTQIELQVTDSRGRNVHNATMKLSDMGTFDGELSLSDDASLGKYHISARIGNWGFGVRFDVAEYRKPEFEVSLAADKDTYVQGDQISVAGTGNYYFGQPLANSDLNWRVTSDNYFFGGVEGGYQFVDHDLVREAQAQGESSRTQGKGTTDNKGSFAFQFPADLSKDLLSQRFIIEATLADDNNQQVSSRTEVLVHKSERYVGLRPEQYVAKTGDSAAVELIVVDTERQPVANSPVSVSFYHRKWLSVKELQPDGSYLWTSKPEDTLIESHRITTDSSGKAKASTVVDKSGLVRVVAEVADSANNKMRSATYIYVSGSGYASWRMESNDRIELVLDRSEYSVGDTAKVLIPSPVEGAIALVTVERGQLLSHRVVKLDGNSETLEFPVEKSYLPNVYISAVLFKGSGGGGVSTFKVGYGQLNVSVADKKLDIALKPDKARYEPGEQSTYTLKTTDSTGKGVPAEVSLAVVDASVLALAYDNSLDIIDSFWGRRGLGVNTAATLCQSVDRHNDSLSKENKGAGDGAEAVSVRREFPDTAYWNPSVRTDDNGEATVKFNVPDSLTTWRAKARGVTASTQLGGASVDTVTTKSLLLRPAFPRFLLMGDQLQLAALLHNYTEGDVEVEVSLTAKGVQPEGSGGFATHRVKIAAGEHQKLEWPARVESVAGPGSEAVLTIAAKPLAEGVPGDTVEITLPVHTLTTAEVVATSGEVQDSTTELVRLPEGINPALGELTIETSPSLAAGMRYSARFLDEFPYECTEQTVSRFLPRVVMQRAFDKLGLKDSEGIASELPSIVGRSLQRLYAGQRADGGWGWWPGDGSDQWITAYTVHGLVEARRSGHTVDQGVLDRAIKFLRSSLDQPRDVEHPENPNSRAYVLYVLAQAGKGDVGLTNALYDRRSILDNYGKAYLLLALHSLGAGKEDSKLQSLLSDLTGAAIASATGSHWEEKTVDYRTMNSNTRSTAIVLNALVRAAPEHPMVSSTVRWLMVARKEGHWETTQETALSLLALTDYLEASGELKGDYSYRVTLNEKELATNSVNPENVDEAKRLVVEVKDLLTGSNNKVNLARAKTPDQSGEGKLYYTMHLRYFNSAEQVPAVAEGLALIREYYRLDDEAAGPVTHVKAGETVKVKLTLLAMQDLHYLVVEDPLPSGLEAVDTRLKTTSLIAQEQTGMVELEDADTRKKQELAGRSWWSYNYFNHVEPRDDRVALFATYLPKGSYEYTYLAQATSEGEFQAMPTRGYEMYFPEVWGRSEGGKLTVSGQ